MPVPAPFTDQEIADQLTHDGLHWASDTISYSFNNLSTAGNALGATVIGWIEQAITTVAEIIDIDFTFTNGDGDLTFNGSSNNGTYASTGYGLPGYDIRYSNIFFDQTWNSNQASNIDYGSYGYMTILHEFLHGLGLHHPGEYNGSADYLDDAEFEQDTHRYTVMSYFNTIEDNSGAVNIYESGGSYYFAYAATPMVYDILALTEGSFDGKFGGYELNTTTRTENTTYGYNATNGINDAFDFNTNVAPVVTLYDAGGIDTLDLSGDTESTTTTVTYNGDGSVDDFIFSSRTTSVIDLREGAYSSTHGMKGNIGIAFGTEIENAIGTQFNDTIYGNDLDNLLKGGAGADTIYGGVGNDIIYADNEDTIYGGEGYDIFYNFASVFRGFDLASAEIEQMISFENGNTVTTVRNDDGSIDEATYDTADTQDYSFYANHYNAEWQLYLQQFIEENGNTRNLGYDIYNEESYQYYQNTYNSEGQLLLQQIRDDNGNERVLGYDLTDDEAWIHYQNTYDPDGNLLESLLQMDDGSVLLA